MAIASPCVNNCCLDQADICIGCGRTLQEITQWTSHNDSQKQQVLLDAKQRCAERKADYPTYAAKYGL